MRRGMKLEISGTTGVEKGMGGVGTVVVMGLPMYIHGSRAAGVV